jgi:hypothetical protein
MFSKNPISSDGLHCYCKPCDSEYQKEWYKTNKEKKNKSSKDWIYKNKEKHNEFCKNYLLKKKEIHGNIEKKYKKPS